YRFRCDGLQGFVGDTVIAVRTEAFRRAAIDDTCGGDPVRRGARTDGDVRRRSAERSGGLESELTPALASGWDSPPPPAESVHSAAGRRKAHSYSDPTLTPSGTRTQAGAK